MQRDELLELFLIYKAALTDNSKSSEDSFEADPNHIYSTLIIGVGDSWKNSISLSVFESPIIKVEEYGNFYQLTEEGRGAVRLMRKSLTQEEIRKRAIDLREELLSYEGRRVWKR